MLEGEGFYRGSTILVSGTAGTGKTSMASHFAAAACRRGERVLFVSFEESPSQLLRNARSIGLDFEPWVTTGLMRFHAARPTVHGLEKHLVGIHKLVADFEPDVVIIDPITNLSRAGSESAASSMLLRVIDHLKNREATAMLTALTGGEADLETSDAGVSSVVDSWLLLRDVELNGERNRCLYILKSRGMSHSNQLREFMITSRGIELVDVYVGAGGVLTGSSRLGQEAREAADALLREQTIERKRREVARKRVTLEARIAALNAEFAADEDELQRVIEQEQAVRVRLDRDRADMARSRRADANGEERGDGRATGA
jgi:circadian clock protein KaiC